mmetsp:Transcript_3090/g.6396  ORF Transcript_3090/g.6396 Transcript_3090/m.6396 type:complete len:570 (-) Transcript_3090:4946-6655(-)
MKKNSVASSDNQEKNPTALVSLQYTSRSAQDLSEIRQFKNLTELDISSNMLCRGVPELLNLRYLRRLTFSDNGLTCVQDLPETIEVLVLSHNLLQNLQIGSLRRLHTLDVSNNQLSSLEGLELLSGLKCLYMTHNRLESLDGLERNQGLLELDVAQNPIKTIEGLHALELNDSLSVLNLKDTPYYNELRKELIFNTCITSPFDFDHLEEGLFCRRLDRLKELKSSRFRRKIRKLKAEPEQSASPEWAYSKRASQEPLVVEPKRKKFELKLVTADDKGSRDEASLGFSPTDEHAKSTETAPRRNSQLQAELEDREALEMRLEHLENKWWNHYEGSAESYLDDLIAYCLGQEYLSTSSDKYELAVAAIKDQENERRRLLQERNSHEEVLASLREDAEAYKAQLEDMEMQLNRLTGLSSPDESRMFILESKLLNEKRIRVKMAAELKQSQETFEKLHLENENLKEELTHVSKGFMKKIRELESSRQLSSSEADSDSLMAESASLQLTDFSYFKKSNEGGKVTINKQVGAFIEKLKAKNAKLIARLKIVRQERDKYKNISSWALDKLEDKPVA